MEPEFAELSLNTVVGLSSPKTMKLRGSIQDVDMTVMIDSGASHNFISQKLVDKLALSLDVTKCYRVIMGTGLAVKGAGVCRAVKVLMQNYTATTNLLPLTLGNADVILGVEWLETLGDVKSNWKEQRMSFKQDGKTVTLQGDSSLCNGPVSLKTLLKTVRDDGEGVLVEFGGLQTEGWKGETENSPEWEAILGKYEGIFGEPQGLPPS